jgi:hypothetical protein
MGMHKVHDAYIGSRRSCLSLYKITDVRLKPLTPLFWLFIPESLDTLMSSANVVSAVFGFFAALCIFPVGLRLLCGRL